LLTGANVAGDVAAGQSFKEAAKSRITSGVQEGIKDFFPDPPAQSGSGIGRKRSLSGRKAVKRKIVHRQHHHHQRDIFSQ
jgi:hypothetical protein